MIQFQGKHLDALLASEVAPAWRGATPASWFGSVSKCAVGINLPDHAQRRADLRSYCLDPTISTETCVIAVLAWGGMRVANGRKAWRVRADWIGEIERLRSSHNERSEDYDRLRGLRPKKLVGMRPAYFTKLLFFLRPSQDALIMDQWTAKSIQLLTGERRPRLLRGNVSDANTGQDYGWYCRAVEGVATRGGWTSQETEERLFSGGGRQPGAWRAYVKHYWRSL